MSYIETPRNKRTRVLSSVDDRRPKYKESIRNDIALIHSEYQLATFDSEYFDHAPYYISPPTSSRGKYRFVKSRVKMSALEVFKDSRVLPYIPRISPDNFQKEIQLLDKSLPAPDDKTRSPMLYRLSQKWLVDDLGRFYYFFLDRSRAPNSRVLRWMQYYLSGEARSRVTLTNDNGTSLTLPVYTFSGLAGYDPDIQDHFISSGRYQFHHIEENKLDLRPTRVVPLESDLHNFIHDQYTESGGWFNRSKMFYV